MRPPHPTAHDESIGYLLIVALVYVVLLATVMVMSVV